MASKTLLAQIKLRRDNDYVYETKKSTFIPLQGEVCFVDTAKKGLRAKVGDGKTTWENLPYTDEAINTAINSIVQRGYYDSGKFYTDSIHSEELISSNESIYIDANTSVIYTYNGEKYVSVNDTLPTASASQSGILKLYSTTGQNVDGTMTQKAISDELNKKIEASVNGEDELLIFSFN